MSSTEEEEYTTEEEEEEEVDETDIRLEESDAFIEGMRNFGIWNSIKDGHLINKWLTEKKRLYTVVDIKTWTTVYKSISKKNPFGTVELTETQLRDFYEAACLLKEHYDAPESDEYSIMAHMIASCA